METRIGGITLANFYKPIPELSIDADISFAHAQFSGVPAGQTHISGALEKVVADGISWNPPTNGGFGAVRARHFGGYPLIEDNSMRASSASLASADLGYLFLAGTRVQASVLNVLNSRADDIRYYYPAVAVDGVHIHTVEPRQVRVSMEFRF